VERGWASHTPLTPKYGGRISSRGIRRMTSRVIMRSIAVKPFPRPINIFIQTMEGPTRTSVAMKSLNAGIAMNSKSISFENAVKMGRAKMMSTMELIPENRAEHLTATLTVSTSLL